MSKSNPEPTAKGRAHGQLHQASNIPNDGPLPETPEYSTDPHEHKLNSTRARTRSQKEVFELKKIQFQKTETHDGGKIEKLKLKWLTN